MATSSYNFLAFLDRSGLAQDECELFSVTTVLPSCSPRGPWLAGGAIRRTVLGQSLDSDFDYFFYDEAQLRAFADAIVALGGTLEKSTEHHESYRVLIDGKSRLVQCIKFKYYETAEQVVESFDYTICQLASDGSRLIVGEHTLWDLGRKRLAIHEITYPVSTMRRMLKYTRQGFYACAGCMQAILARTVASPELQMQLDTEYVD